MQGAASLSVPLEQLWFPNHRQNLSVPGVATLGSPHATMGLLPAEYPSLPS